MTRKHPASASGAARVISKILREDGFEKANTKSRFGWTEGYYVHRVGHSKTVHVDYHVSDYPPEEKRNLRRSKVAQMRELLFELGYISSHPKAIYIECRES